MRKVTKTYIIMHNMAVEVRVNHCYSEILRLMTTAFGRNVLLDENGNEVPFKWACTGIEED